MDIVFVGLLVYALDASAGALKWSFETRGNVVSDPADSNDGAIVFVGSLDNNVSALGALNGMQKWFFQTGDQVESSPAVSKDGQTVVVSSYDNKVYATDVMTGAQKWVFVTGGSGLFVARRQRGCIHNLRGVKRQQSLCAGHRHYPDHDPHHSNAYSNANRQQL